MLKRSLHFTAEAAEVSALLVADYLAGNGVTADFMASLLSVDQVLFTMGLSKPLVLLNVFQHSFALRMGRRICELVVAGCMLCGNTLTQSAAQMFLTTPDWQSAMFEGFWPARLLKAIGTCVTPRRLVLWGKMVSGQSPDSDKDDQANAEYAEFVRKAYIANDGRVSGLMASAWRVTVAENLVCDVSAIVSDQIQWAGIYVKEVLLPWKAGKGSLSSLTRRTVKSHIASTVLSVAEIFGHLVVRFVGKQAAVKILSRTRFDANLTSSGVFWVEHALLLACAPLLVRASQVAAGCAYHILEATLPSTEEDLQADAEDAEKNRDEEAEVRDHYMASQNKNDLYATIGVTPSATETDIKKAYRQKALQYHPDRVAHLSDEQKAQAQQAMAALNDAYEVLSCSSKRTMYDHSRAQSNILGFDETNPPKIIESFMQLPMVVQVPLGLGIMALCTLLGGVVIYAHVRSQFLTLTSPGRTPMRAVVLGNSM